MNKEVDLYIKSIITEFDIGYIMSDQLIKKTIAISSMIERTALSFGDNAFFALNIRMDKVEH